MPISTVWILNYVQQFYVKWFWTISSLGAPGYTLFILDTLFVTELKRLLVTEKYLLFPLSSDDSFQFRQVHVTVAVVFKLNAIFSISNRPIEVQSQLKTILNKNVLQNIKEENQIALTCCSQRKVFTPAPGHIILTQGSHYLLLLGQEESSDSLGQCCFCFVFKLSNVIILGVCIGNSMICSDIWHKYHEWYFEIVIRNFMSR